MVWYEDLAPRGRNNVTISTTVSRDKAAQLDKIGYWPDKQEYVVSLCSVCY